MSQKSLSSRVASKVKKILRDEFGFFYPLGGQTVLAVTYALQHKIAGHYYEFGLYQGYTFGQAAKLSPDIHHFGFDSFEGMPENNEGGGFGFQRFKVTYEKVINNLLRTNAFTHKEHLIKGYFSDSLTPQLQAELMPFKAAVILIDCDIYDSTVTVLNFIKPLLQTGTIVIFDDWHSFGQDEGEQRALREFLEINKNYTFSEINECQNRKLFKVSILD
ncbi:MAG: TylF/MycF/NovP-related O-methyltransferase [Patescibacteria group bacterium]